ncbi:MAG: glycosyltransferase family 39 protein [Chloroflexota bacterium]|nr:glycosyltransferase family 39 protein [Chloroflexota bacterium]MDQ5865322.1 glycosyltransferase family 39 protein [Chloroflexota bacterium]
MQITQSRWGGGTVPAPERAGHATTDKLVAKDALKFSFFLWLAVRLALSAWAALSIIATGEARTVGADAQHYLFGVWHVFDSHHYINIATNGYESDPYYLTAFFPGFPLLIKCVSFLLFDNPLLAALLVANVSTIFFFWYLYRLVEADYGEQVARRAVVFSAVFPTSYYLFMGYTEAPLLAFSVAALYYGRQGKWWAAGMLAGAAALVKQPGIFLFAPLAYMYVRHYMAHTSKETRSVLGLVKRLDWAWLLLCPATALSYTAYRYLLLGSQFKGPTDLGASEMLQFPGAPLVQALQVAHTGNPLLAFNLMEIAFTLLMIGLVIGSLVKLRSATYAIYSLLIAVVSLSVTWPHIWRPEADMPRRMLIIFPLFIYLALVINNRRAFMFTAAASFLVGLVLSFFFVNGFFIS